MSCAALALLAASALPNLEAFVDGVVGSYMSQQQIAGVEVAVVRNGETLLVKGYGIDSVEPRRAVDPRQSLFRLGSISKTFTWISIMQLVERGQLKLDDPINDHLPDELDVPDEGFEQPIRIIDLMNHSAGFEDILQGLFVAQDAPLRSLSQHLQTLRPHRVREPGKLMAYSNYSTALAGAIVAQVSEMEYETYVERNILTPLGLTHTTFREQYAPTEGLPQPMPAELAAHMAQNIESRDGAWQSLPHEHIVSMAPAGAAVSTAEDMAKYMISLLDPQRLEAAGVLRADTFALLREPSFQVAPGMPAIHHGFFNTPLGIDQRLAYDNLSHSGGTLHFRTFMVVIPATGPDNGTLGVFVAANSGTAGRMVQAVPERILAEYFGQWPEAEVNVAQATPARVGEYAGQYRSLRRSYTQLEKIFAIGTVPITATPDGSLMMRLGGPAMRFVAVGKDLFRQPDGDMTMAFLRDPRGAVSHVVTPVGTFERVGFFMSPQWLALTLGTGVAACIGILIAAALRRDPTGQAIAERRSAQVITGTAAAWLVFMILIAAWLLPFMAPGGQDQFIYNYPHALLKLSLAVGVVATGLSVLGIATLLPVWRERTWSIGRRLRHSVAVALFVGLVATLLQWNAIGFRYF